MFSLIAIFFLPNQHPKLYRLKLVPTLTQQYQTNSNTNIKIDLGPGAPEKDLAVQSTGTLKLTIGNIGKNRQNAPVTFKFLGEMAEVSGQLFGDEPSLQKIPDQSEPAILSNRWIISNLISPKKLTTSVVSIFSSQQLQVMFLSLPIKPVSFGQKYRLTLSPGYKGTASILGHTKKMGDIIEADESLPLKITPAQMTKSLNQTGSFTTGLALSMTGKLNYHITEWINPSNGKVLMSKFTETGTAVMTVAGLGVSANLKIQGSGTATLRP